MIESLEGKGEAEGAVGSAASHPGYHLKSAAMASLLPGCTGL